MEDGEGVDNYCIRLNSVKWLTFDCFDLLYKTSSFTESNLKSTKVVIQHLEFSPIFMYQK